MMILSRNAIKTTMINMVIITTIAIAVILINPETTEIKKAIKTMKNGKATGRDNISKEMIEACEYIGLTKIQPLATEIYDSDKIPQASESPFL